MNKVNLGIKNKLSDYYKYSARILAITTPLIQSLLLLLHFTYKDQYPILSTIFYATPLPLLFYVSIAYCIFMFFNQKKTFFYLSLIFSFFIGCCWFSQSYYINSQNSREGNIRILCWNIHKNANSHFNKLKTVIEDNNPDIFGLIQVGDNQKQEAGKRLNEALPLYRFKVLEQGMIIGIKGEIIDNSYIDITEGKVNKLHVIVKNKKLMIYLLHLGRTPDTPRKYPLNELYNIVKKDKNSKLIVMGDFNTPYNSFWFEKYKANLTHSFATAGKGLIETWRVPIPLLALDHIWVSKAITQISCQHKSSSISDHKLIITNLLVD